MSSVPPINQLSGTQSDPSPEARSSQTEQQWVIRLSTTTGLILILVLSVFAVAPLLYPGYVQTHSGFVPLWNIVDLRANIVELGWVPHLGTRFDPLRSPGLLPYYVAGLLLPLPPSSALKLLVGLSWVFGGIGIFLWLRSWLGNTGALTAALVYIYLPHQIVTVYVRGAWGETLFWGLLPWAILAATFMVTSPRLILLPIALVFWLALGLSQLGLTVWALLFLIALLLTVHRPQALLPAVSALLGTVSAIGVYLLPPPHALFVDETTPFAHHFLYPFQLFSAYWGIGSSKLGPGDGLSLQIGLAAIGLACLGVYLWLFGQEGQPQLAKRSDRRLIFFSGAAIVLILLQFSPAIMVWDLPLWPGSRLSATLTYPWQLLGFIGLCLSILAGIAVWLERQLSHMPIFAAIVIIIILSVYSYLSPQFIQPDSEIVAVPQAELGRAQLALLDHGFTVLTPGHTVGLDRGQTSIPFALHSPLQPGNILVTNVTWQPIQTFDNDLKVFVHLIDSGENVLAQFDGQPRQGTYRTSQWIPGELINDSYPIRFPADAPPGPYRVFVGLYDEVSLERLSVSTDFAGRVMLDVK